MFGGLQLCRRVESRQRTSAPNPVFLFSARTKFGRLAPGRGIAPCPRTGLQIFEIRSRLSGQPDLQR